MARSLKEEILIEVSSEMNLTKIDLNAHEKLKLSNDNNLEVQSQPGINISKTANNVKL